MEKDCENCKFFYVETYNFPCVECDLKSLDMWQERNMGKKQTNADRIRAMSDVELAEFLEDILECDKCPIIQECTTYIGMGCLKRLLKWLQSEVEET